MELPKRIRLAHIETKFTVATSTSVAQMQSVQFFYPELSLLFLRSIIASFCDLSHLTELIFCTLFRIEGKFLQVVKNLTIKERVTKLSKRLSLQRESSFMKRH